MDILGIFVMIYALLMMVSPVIMMIYRKEPFFHHRRPLLLFIYTFLMSCVIISLSRPHTYGRPWNMVDGLDEHYCLFLEVAGITNMIFASVMIIFRSLLLLASNLRAIFQTEDVYLFSFFGFKTFISKSFFLSHRRLFEEKTVYRFGHLYAAILIVIYMITLTLQKTDKYIFSNTIDFCLLFARSQLAASIIGFITVIGEICIFFLLKNVKDNFKIATESKFNIALTITMGIISNCFGFTMFSDKGYVIAYNLFNIIIYSLSICILVHFPVYKYFTTKRIQPSPSTKTIEVILNNKIAFDNFLKFLTREFASENIIFLKAVADFKRSKNEQQEATLLLAKFIQHGSLFEVNLPQFIRLGCISDVENNNFHSAFDKPYAHIKDLMENDALPRFWFEVTKSDSYQSMLSMDSTTLK